MHPSKPPNLSAYTPVFSNLNDITRVFDFRDLPGPIGKPGPNGHPGEQGPQGSQGMQGAPGPHGKEVSDSDYMRLQVSLLSLTTLNLWSLRVFLFVLNK